MRTVSAALVTIAFIGLGASSLAAQQPVAKIKEEHPGLLRQATVTPDSATAIALRAVPGATVKSAEIEKEDGRLVYSFDLVIAGKSGVEEVLVDARTGKVVSKEHEDEAAEQAEQQHDARPPR